MHELPNMTLESLYYPSMLDQLRQVPHLNLDVLSFQYLYYLDMAPYNLLPHLIAFGHRFCHVGHFDALSYSMGPFLGFEPPN